MARYQCRKGKATEQYTLMGILIKRYEYRIEAGINTFLKMRPGITVATTDSLYIYKTVLDIEGNSIYPTNGLVRTSAFTLSVMQIQKTLSSCWLTSRPMIRLAFRVIAITLVTVCRLRSSPKELLRFFAVIEPAHGGLNLIAMKWVTLVL